MYVIPGRNINHVWPLALMYMRDGARDGTVWARDSRNGTVFEFNAPVTSVYRHPEECVLFDPQRDANPFFHLFEFLWIVAGRSDVRFLQHFVRRMSDYSDDGKTFHGSYGRRLEGAIELCINRLRKNPDDRRAVAPIYWPSDTSYDGKDMPCNIAAMFKVRNGALTLTVANRSNDAVYGAYGANVVQFGLLTAYAALAAGYEIGEYSQVSDSLHLYANDPKSKACLDLRGINVQDPYEQRLVRFVPFFTRGDLNGHDRWIDDLASFFRFWDHEGPIGVDASPEAHLRCVLDPDSFRTPWWNSVALPMWNAHCYFRAGRIEEALDVLGPTRPAPEVDWHVGARQWLLRRHDKRAEAANGAA